MRTSAILPIAAALVAAVALAMPAGAKTISKTKVARCSQVYDDCAKSPLCHSSNYAVREQCKGRCTNKQAKCLGFPIFSGVGTNKEGKDGTTKGRVPIGKPAVKQPTSTVGTSGTGPGSPIAGNAVKQPTKTIGVAPILRGGRPSQNRK